MIDFNVSSSRFDVSIQTIFDSHNSPFSPVRPGSQPHSQDSLFRGRAGWRPGHGTLELLLCSQTSTQFNVEVDF